MSSDAELIGQRLREAREARDLTLDDMAGITRIRVRFLEALETGDYSSMTPVQAQGFMRNYARFLGLDLDLMLAELDDDRSSRTRRRRREQLPTGSASPVQPVARAPRSRSVRATRRSRGVIASALIVLIAGAIVVGLIFGVTTLLDRWAETETQPVLNTLQTPAPPPTEDLAAVQDGLLTPAPLDTPAEGLADGVSTEAPTAEAGNEPGFTPPPLTGTSVTVLVEVTQGNTWVRITSDGAVQFEGIAQAGAILNYSGQTSVAVRTNNAAGLRLTVNNVPQGSLGARGQLFDYTFTLNGVALPGAQSQVVPSAEPELTASPEGAALLFSPEPSPATPAPPAATLPLDPGDGSVLESASPTAAASFTPAFSPTVAIIVVTRAPLPTSTASATPRPTATPSITFTPPPSVTATPVPTATSSPTLTLTPVPGATSTPIPSATATPTSTATPSATGTPSRTPTRTPSPTPTLTPEFSPTPTLTPSSTPFLPPRLTRTPSPTPK